jgi:lipopolysaccharide heptosyltransferase II
MSLEMKMFNPKRILIIKLGALGDVVLISAALKAIRAHYPKAHISCLVSEVYAPLLEAQEALDEVHIISQRLVKKWVFFALFKQVHHLRQLGYDLLIDFQNNKKSHLLGWLTRIPRRLGYRRKWGMLLTDPVSLPKEKLLPVDHQFFMLKKLGITKPNEPRLSLSASQSQKLAAQALLQDMSGPFVGINLSASPRWQTKQWTDENLLTFVQLVTQAGYRVILNGTVHEAAKAQYIVQVAGNSVIDLVGKADIPTLLGVISYCDLFVSPDTAPLHMAAALGVPVVGLFGPTDPARYAPPTDKGVMLSVKLPCSPCHAPTCHLGTHACMQQLTAQQVVQAAKQLGLNV